MLNKITIIILLFIFSVSFTGCGHIKRPFKNKPKKKFSHNQINKIPTFAEYIKTLPTVNT
jgi:hypothetical protein